MPTYVISFMKYGLANWETLLAGGTVVMGVVIFVLGCFKGLLAKIGFDQKFKKGVRKAFYGLMSLILVIPATAASIALNGFDWNYFWLIYVLNAGETIIGYHVYETYGPRSAVRWLLDKGKKAFPAFWGVLKNNPKNTEIKPEYVEISNKVHNEVANTITNTVKDTAKNRVFIDHDLDNL